MTKTISPIAIERARSSSARDVRSSGPLCIPMSRGPTGWLQTATDTVTTDRQAPLPNPANQQREFSGAFGTSTFQIHRADDSTRAPRRSTPANANAPAQTAFA